MGCDKLMSAAHDHDRWMTGKCRRQVRSRRDWIVGSKIERETRGRPQSRDISAQRRPEPVTTLLTAIDETLELTLAVRRNRSCHATAANGSLRLPEGKEGRSEEDMPV